MAEPFGEGAIVARFQLVYRSFGLDLDVSLPGRGVTALFGPSGSGKTTALRCVAGLVRAQKGRLQIGDDVWQDEERRFFLPTHRRPLGMVFQDAALFPHLTVFGNLRYGMNRSGSLRNSIDPDAILTLLGIGNLLGRYPRNLSGGERQRVAIARALFTEPRLLLLDEPLAALDLKRKHEILPYLERLRDELDIPILYVSHSPEEVARLADHIVLLEAGQVVASGPVSEILTRVDLPFAFLEEAGVVFDVVVAESEDGLTRLASSAGDFMVAHRLEPQGRRLRCQIQARDVSLTLSRHSDTTILNILPATVTDIAHCPIEGHVLARLTLQDGSGLLARITERSRRDLRVAPGSKLWAQVKAVALLSAER